MMEFYVSGQSLKMFTPVTAADSLKYLTAQFHFTGDEWDGYTRWAHFRRGETVYDIELDEEDRITEEDALNLTTGEWEIYLTGTKDTARLTTVVVVLTVKESGLVDAPLHVLPQSVAEQIDAKAAQALLTAQAVKAAADAGKFNGRDGKSFEIKGYYASTAALEEGVPAPAPGDAYCVGSAAPYDVYIYDGVSGEWINNGTIQGAKGDTGAAGTTFTPHVDGNGNLSWTNDGGLENPATQNIRGAAGAKGETGAAGKSAYTAAVEAGYTGTEATFYAALTAMPYHNARHLPDGADPITVKAGNLEASAVETAKIKDKAVTTAKLADLAVTRAKLAQDALFSPWIVSGSRDIVASDIGGTIQNNWEESATYTLTQALSATLPMGAELAVLRGGTYEKTIVSIVGSGIRFGIPDDMPGGPMYPNATLKITSYLGLVAIRKIAADNTNGDLWGVYGNVEVVT